MNSLAVDFIGSGKGIPTLLELPWVCEFYAPYSRRWLGQILTRLNGPIVILLILFVASGATTYGNVSAFWTSGVSCDQLKNVSVDFGPQYGSVQIGQDYVTLCKDAHPIGIVAWTCAVIREWLRRLR